MTDDDDECTHEHDEEFAEFLSDVSQLIETVTDSLADAMFIARNATRAQELVDVIKGLREACAVASGMADECGPMLDEMVKQLEPEGTTAPLSLSGSKQSDPDPTLN